MVNLKCRINKQIFLREIFIQQHSVKRPDADKPQGKTLFLLNIPPYVHRKELEYAFSSVGPIENVILKENVVGVANPAEASPSVMGTQKAAASKYFSSDKPIDKFKTAYIVFKSTKSLQSAMQRTEVCLFDSSTGENVLKTGIDRWKDEHTDGLTDENELEAEVNSFMKAFETREEKERRGARKTEVDADGWITVKRGKNAGFEQKESILKALEEKMAKDKKRKEFTNFYTFQLRESKQKHIYSLRRKFEQDKLKIDAMKKARRFKPF